jgi:hypothetical protein
VARASGGSLRVYVSWNGATDVARWRLRTGASPQALAPLSTAADHGFETVLRAPAAARFLDVEALDAHGRVLTSTPTVARPD